MCRNAHCSLHHSTNEFIAELARSSIKVEEVIDILIDRVVVERNDRKPTGFFYG